MSIRDKTEDQWVDDMFAANPHLFEDPAARDIARNVAQVMRYFVQVNPFVGVTEEVFAELNSAREKHGSLNSAHEGFAVLLEEVDELKAEVWKREHDKARMRAECIQIAAMAIKFIEDVTEEKERRNNG